MLIPTRQAKAVDAQTAGIAKMIGGVLIIHGAFGLYRDWGELTAAQAATPVSAPAVAKEKKDIMLDLLEIAGGAAAMMMNADSENDLKQEGYMPEGAPPGGAPGGGTTAGGPGEIADTCAMMPTLCQKNSRR